MLEERAAQLGAEASSPSLWDDQSRARRVMSDLAGVRADIDLWSGLKSRVADARELAELVEPGSDPGMEGELEAEAARLAAALNKAETELMFSGSYDSEGAILSIHAGAGGTESQDWAEMLQRMFVRWAEDARMGVLMVATTPGEEAGIKSTTMQITGRRAYGWLKSERGVHRLVRISPFDASSRRHTSFALVEVSPLIDDSVDVAIDEKDVKLDVFRASGAGGQHVNKTSSAVRLTHVPTGIVVACQNERSQTQNRTTAMTILKARLVELELERIEAEQARLKGQHVEAGWGNQIRSYVLHPYQMVKDHRTGAETGKTDAVLNGDLEMFQVAYLRHQIGEEDAIAPQPTEEVA
jgi:peptide chain release factor 2